MRDTKSLLLLLVSLMLVLVSFGLLWTWGYRFIKNDNNIKPQSAAVVNNSTGIAEQIRDSLEKVYTTTIRDLDAQLDSTLTNTDSLKNELDFKLSEFYRLRNEITAILKNRNAGNDFKVAKQKIGELQNKVQDFRDKNQVVENENKKLNTILTELEKTETKAESRAKQPVNDSRPLVEKPASIYQVFSTSGLNFSALTVNNDEEVETNSADKAAKLTGSFTVTNFNSQLTNVEMVVVILQPNGQVLKTSGWESGTFNTADGKKIYSYKFNFNYSRGEAKKLAFTLKTGSLVKGNYTMAVYYNGQMIGKTVKTFS